MSWHILAHRTNPKSHFVVGFDRPLQAFFIQVWTPQDEDQPTYTDDCFDLGLLEDTNAVVPEGLREILVQECLGERDPNIIHDWRVSPMMVTRRDPPEPEESLA